MCVTLIEGYSRAANRSGIRRKKFLIENLISHHLIERIFGLFLSLSFLGAQIYEAIAAIFWQSASYILSV